MPFQKTHSTSIILADDDDDDIMLFLQAAEQLSANIKVSLASDGMKLLSVLELSSLPDMIFLDLNMPCKTGLECLRVIRSSAKYDCVPVVIYSTSQNKKDIDECRKAGADYYVVKPYSFEDIVGVLKKLLLDAVSRDPTPGFFVINTQQKSAN